MRRGVHFESRAECEMAARSTGMHHTFDFWYVCILLLIVTIRLLKLRRRLLQSGQSFSGQADRLVQLLFFHYRP